VLIYSQTGSAALTGLTYALTFVPSLVGGAVLAGLADRYPRRTVMIVSDVLRAVFMAVIAIWALPVTALDGVLVMAVLSGAPFVAASVAELPTILDAQRYPAGASLRQLTSQLVQLVGFAGGGLLVGVIGARGALGIDAVTFLLSAGLLRTGLIRRDAAGVLNAVDPARYWVSMRQGMSAVFKTPVLRTLLLFAWLAGFFTAPDGVAATYASTFAGHNSGITTGLLMAAPAGGACIGLVAWSRLSPTIQDRLIGPSAVLAGFALALCLFDPSLPVALGLWLLSGFGSAFQVRVLIRFIAVIADRHRATGAGFGAATLTAVQGLGVFGAGALAGAWSPATAIGLFGIAGALSAAVLWATLLRAQRPHPDNHLHEVAVKSPRISTPPLHELPASPAVEPPFLTVEIR
jgi:MFS family permease